MHISISSSHFAVAKLILHREHGYREEHQVDLGKYDFFVKPKTTKGFSITIWSLQKHYSTNASISLNYDQETLSHFLQFTSNIGCYKAVCREVDDSIETAKLLFSCKVATPFLYNDTRNDNGNVGIYNKTTDQYVTNDVRSKHKFAFLSPYNISGFDAGKICASLGKTWTLMPTPERYNVSMLIHNWVHYQMKMNVYMRMQETFGFYTEVDMNTLNDKSQWRCDVIDYIKNLVRHKYIKVCKKDECTTRYVIYDNMEEIIDLNEAILCKNKRDIEKLNIDTRSKLCGLSFFTAATVETLSALVPCNTVLYNMGVMCQKSVTEKTTYSNSKRILNETIFAIDKIMYGTQIPISKMYLFL